MGGGMLRVKGESTEEESYGCNEAREEGGSDGES